MRGAGWRSQPHHAVQAAVTTCSMATCSMVLLSVLKTAGSLVSEREEAAFMAECHRFATRSASCQLHPAMTVCLGQISKKAREQCPLSRCTDAGPTHA